MIRRKRYCQLMSKLLSIKLRLTNYIINESRTIPAMKDTDYEPDITLKALNVHFIESSQQSYEISIVIAPLN